MIDRFLIILGCAVLLGLGVGCATVDSTHGFEFSDPSAWRIENGSLELFGPVDYQPPFRSPHHIALLDSTVQGSFTLEADLKQTGREYGHRDLCIFVCFESPSRYIYAHLATKADDNAHHIMLVDGAPRRPITTARTTGIDWGDDEWKHVRVVFDAEDRSLRVYFDSAPEPVLVAMGVPMEKGRVGFGSFDDSGRFENITLVAESTTIVHQPVFETLP